MKMEDKLEVLLELLKAISSCDYKKLIEFEFMRREKDGLINSNHYMISMLFVYGWQYIVKLRPLFRYDKKLIIDKINDKFIEAIFISHRVGNKILTHTIYLKQKSNNKMEV
ncbi:MAG: hypothetical protein N2505_07130 [Endomicrobia bacterium]|nr:hypothetical protein [Endomicrobiia bacterium]